MRETRWHTCSSANGKGQNRHFMSHFLLRSPARTSVANGDAPAGTLTIATVAMGTEPSTRIPRRPPPNPIGYVPLLSFPICPMVWRLLQFFLGFLMVAEREGGRWRPETGAAVGRVLSAKVTAASTSCTERHLGSQIMGSGRVCLVGGSQEDPVPWRGAAPEAGTKRSCAF
jgi:hypothetical protein